MIILKILLVIFIILSLIALLTRHKTIIDSPYVGKRVKFISDDKDDINADGLKGHLEIIGDIKYKRSFYDRYIKRLLDIIISFFGLVILSPLLLAISIIIKIEDPGPILFCQNRVGLNKTYFKLHKFRSMRMDTPHNVPTHMLDNPNKYITKIGKFIRSHSLDELPQIWDIFIGNMSIIGPRPALYNQDSLISLRDETYSNNIKPGLTGLAQINGRDELSLIDKARLDGEYTKNISFILDLKIFLGSLGVFKHDDSIKEGKSNNEVEMNLKKIPKALCKENLNLKENKNVLITGKNSYIGNNLKTYLSKFNNYKIDSLDLRNDKWKLSDFSKYDVIVNVSGIAHIKETKDNYQLYFDINRDLALELAKKAKKDKVKQYVYLSSMSVYGLVEGVIDDKTELKPTNAYGNSKLEAEQLLWELNDKDFKVSIVRPPMVYGKACKGNYQLLRKFALKVCMFPKYNNHRSMIYIDNLSSSLRNIIHNDEAGVYFPSNVDYINTYEMVKVIAASHDKHLITISIFNPLIKLFTKKINVFKKVFGDLIYQDLNVPTSWIEIKDNKMTIELSEKE